MKTLSAVLLTASLALVIVSAQKKKEDGPQPRVVDPGQAGKAPSDAVVLFDGKDLSHWTAFDGKAPEWSVQDGVLVCRTGTGDLHSREKFRSAQVHVEFNVPSMPDKTGQARGNSGVLLHSRGREIQILDSYQNATYADGACGAFYGVAAPLVNASRRPGEWQTYDIVFHAPRCGSDGKVSAPGSVSVMHNGILVQDHVADVREPCLAEGSLILQDHNGFRGERVPPGKTLKAPITQMRFRNVWLRRLAD